MPNFLRQAIGRVFNSDGDSPLAIPVLDGAFKPNNILEEAAVFAERAGLEDLALGRDGSLFAACGNEIIKFDKDGRSAVVAEFDSRVQAFAVRSDGGFAVAAGGMVTIKGGLGDGMRLPAVDGHDLRGVNALHCTKGGAVLISDGSRGRDYADWSRDLLEHGRTGRLIEYVPATGKSRLIAGNLAYCFGVAQQQGKTFISESWAHRLLAVEGESSTCVVDSLPGYPARIVAAERGGWWLSLFAGRTQLIEFILREDGYRNEMMRTVPREYWVAPALKSGSDFLEPLQIGGVKQMGVLKPWAPPRSYGLLVRLDSDMRPLYSLHSRVGSKRHGVVAAVEMEDQLYVLSKGADQIVKVSIAKIERQLEVHGREK